MSLAITEKRLRNELKKLQKENLGFAQAIQDEKNQFLFYFLLKGDDDSDYKGGYYIGKIELPKDYPASPGDFYMLTGNGRFEIGHKICLSNSGYHKDSWTPSWDITNMLIGFMSIFNDDTEHGISHIKDSPEKRRMFAKQSISYNLSTYPNIFKRFDRFVNEDGTIKKSNDVDNSKIPAKIPSKKVVKKINGDQLSEESIQEKEILENNDNEKLLKHEDTPNIIEKIPIQEKKILKNNDNDKFNEKIKRIRELIDIIEKTTYDTYNKTHFDELSNLLKKKKLSEL